MDLLMKGEDYGDLCQSYVIFICRADPFDRRQYMMQNIYINDAIYQGREMGRAEAEVQEIIRLGQTETLAH